MAAQSSEAGRPESEGVALSSLAERSGIGSRALPPAALAGLTMAWQSILRRRHPGHPGLVVEVVEADRGERRPGDVALARQLERGIAPDDAHALGERRAA
jgi:hypothetical protein